MEKFRNSPPPRRVAVTAEPLFEDPFVFAAIYGEYLERAELNGDPEEGVEIFRGGSLLMQACK